MLHVGDCLDILPRIDGGSVDAVVTDPPYAIGFMGKEWDSPGKAFVERKADRRNAWDHVGGNHNPINSADQARTRRVEAQRFQQWCQLWATECLRVLRPGGHLVAFGGTRTYHRLTCAIEDAGFEIRDSLHWLYGSGFPKSLDVGKAIDKAAGAEREVLGHDATLGHYDGAPREPGRKLRGATYAQDDYTQQMGRVRAITAPATEDAARWDGWGTALKPAHEPIILARKPLASTVAGNVLAHGTGALNIDACRVGTDLITQHGRNDSPNMSMAGRNYAEPAGRAWAGRWPPNVLLGPEAAAELDRQSGTLHTHPGRYRNDASKPMNGWGMQRRAGNVVSDGDSGGASRFFPVFRYQAKAPASERPRLPDGTAHPTVKPLDLMRWLVRLVTPPGGLVLDPFAGTGTTGEAAILEGFHYVLIEKDPASAELIRRRLSKPLQRGLEGLPAN